MAHWQYNKHELSQQTAGGGEGVLGSDSSVRRWWPSGTFASNRTLLPRQLTYLVSKISCTIFWAESSFIIKSSPSQNSVLRTIFQAWSIPSINVFAASDNNECQQFCSQATVVLLRDFQSTQQGIRKHSQLFSMLFLYWMFVGLPLAPSYIRLLLHHHDSLKVRCKLWQSDPTVTV